MKKLWSGLNYVEICSGPGRCINYHSFLEHDGSSIVVLRHPASIHLASATFIDNDEVSVCHLQKRIDHIGIINACARIADYTEPSSVVKALEGLPQGCLNLLFIDPTNLDFPFESLVAITKHLGQTDIIMTVAMGMDFNRNADKALSLEDSKVRAKYESFLGLEGFFEAFLASTGKPVWQHTIGEVRKVFTEAFVSQLSRLGYLHHDARAIRNLYNMVFASKHSRGLEFWDRAGRIDYFGQRNLYL